MTPRKVLRSLVPVFCLALILPVHVSGVTTLFTPAATNAMLQMLPSQVLSGALSFLLIDHFAGAGTGHSQIRTLDVRVWKSVDGGTSFGSPILVAAGTRSTVNDKEWLAVDASPSSDFQGHVYVSWTRFTTETGALYSQIVLSSSSDGGGTWSAPMPISPKFRVANATSAKTERLVQGSMPTVGPDGTVYVAYYDSLADGFLTGDFTVMITSSNDGGATFKDPTPISTSAEYQESSLPPTVFRAWSSMFPSIDVGPEGNVYASWAAKGAETDDSDILFSRSTNKGVTWIPSIRVNDDSTTHDQFFPSLNVSPDGLVHVFFGDRRDDPRDTLYRIYYAESTDRGMSFKPNVIVSTVPSDATIQDPSFIGDYFSTASASNMLYVAWTDARFDGDQDVFVARGSLPSPFFDSNVRVNNDAPTATGFSMQNEPSVAVNPLDPNRVVVGAHDLRSRLFEAFYYTSEDGGSTWLNRPLPGSESIALISDPVVAFGLSNTVFYAAITTPPSAVALSATSASVEAGVMANGSGFAPFSPVQVSLNDTVLAILVTDSDGRFLTGVTVPPTSVGHYLVKATDGFNLAQAAFQVTGTITGTLISIEGGIGTILTQTGVVTANLNEVGATVTGIDGRLITLSTGIGTLMVDIEVLKNMVADLQHGPRYPILTTVDEFTITTVTTSQDALVEFSNGVITITVAGNGVRKGTASILLPRELLSQIGSSIDKVGATSDGLLPQILPLTKNELGEEYAVQFNYAPSIREMKVWLTGLPWYMGILASPLLPPGLAALSAVLVVLGVLLYYRKRAGGRSHGVPSGLKLDSGPQESGNQATLQAGERGLHLTRPVSGTF